MSPISRIRLHYRFNQRYRCKVLRKFRPASRQATRKRQCKIGTIRIQCVPTKIGTKLHQCRHFRSPNSDSFQRGLEKGFWTSHEIKHVTTTHITGPGVIYCFNLVSAVLTYIQQLLLLFWIRRRLPVAFWAMNSEERQVGN